MLMLGIGSGPVDPRDANKERTLYSVLLVRYIICNYANIPCISLCSLSGQFSLSLNAGREITGRRASPYVTSEDVDISGVSETSKK